MGNKDGRPMPQMVGFCDSDFAGDVITLRSTSGNIVFHRGVAICWSPKRQSLKALSTCEAEYIAMYDCLRVVQSQGFLDFIGLDPPIFCDNQSALALCRTKLVNRKSKHILLRFHVLRDHADKFLWVDSLRNKADGLTKRLCAARYNDFFW